VPRVTTALLVAALFAPPAAAQEKAPPAAPRPLRVLFVGNSQVYFNDLPRMVELLAASAPADRPRVTAGRAVVGGASLESHWNKGDDKGTARAQISEGNWDFVVLQDIYTIRPESFDKHARLFTDLVRKHGGKPVLFATASVSTRYPQGFRDLHDPQAKAAAELKVPLAAAGKAWLTYWGPEPTADERLALYDKDKAHPGKAGSYLYACTLYAALTGQTPVGLTAGVQADGEETVPPPVARRMQEAAWAVHREANPAARPAGSP
jgi:hypothetical protein